jgi:WhiB family redox-sensing transcriptional regulator
MVQSAADPTPGARGLCTYGDDSAWFAKHAVHRARAIAICNNCPIQRKCALDALELDATDGVWGGVWLPGLRDSEGLAAARAKLAAVAERLARQSHAQKAWRAKIQAALEYTAERTKLAEAADQRAKHSKDQQKRLATMPAASEYTAERGRESA